jgi:PAS domain S-box-containing protein
MPQELKPLEIQQTEYRAAELRQLADTIRDEITGHALLIESVRSEAMHNGQKAREAPLVARGAGVWRWDLATGQVMIDANLARMAGLDPATVGETTASRDAFLQLVHPDDRALMATYSADAFPDDEVHLRDCRYVRADSKIRWIRSRGRLVRGDSGEPLAITGTAVDVTDLKLAEEMARRSNEELERRINERTAELQKVNFALMAEVAERRKVHERFLESERLAAIGGAMNGLAHESRNALQRAQACLEMLVREVQDRPEALSLIARIESAQNDLHRLYERVRDYASPLRLDPQRQTISSIVREAWLELEPLRLARIIRLQEVYSGVDQNCEVDRRSMTQVFGHLLKNALAACSDPVEIEIAYFDSELNGQPAVKVELQDNGPGIAANERQKAFTAFYTTNTKGTGLGLAVSKRIVEAHGGQIVLGNNSNGSDSKTGAQFIITLPRRKT